MSNYEYLLSDINNIKGVGPKISKLFRKKNINTIFDLLWRLPFDSVDRSKIIKINELKIGQIQTVRVIVKKYIFPRKRNLPNKVLCMDETGTMECIFFNSYEGYIRKILPLDTKVTINGRINLYKNKYQITNPTYVSDNSNSIEKVDNKYSLTEGLNEKKYRQLINKILENLPNIDEWHNNEILKKFKNISWKNAVLELHNPKNINKKGPFLNRLVYDEIFASFLINSQIRTKIRKSKKTKKKFDSKSKDRIVKKLNFRLTKDQDRSIEEINKDLRSNQKMFRLLQGDVGSGKTIVSLIAAINVINSGYQVCFMAPTEILAKQHFKLAKFLLDKNINIKLLTGKTIYKERKKIIEDLKENNVNLLIGTHSLFQEKINYNKLGLVIIDEQHKFGVKQRKALSDKGGVNCDILVMSATPIPRTMIMSIFGDMDISIIKEKPKNRKEIKTYSKNDKNIFQIINFIKKKISEKDQIFWVCPLIDESKKVDHQSSIQRFNYLSKIFHNRVGLLHGLLSKEEKDNILLKFLNNEIDILVSTTVIEVGIDFPNANVIIIENANKFGLSQLHQLRGRVGRGNKESTCILMFKSSLSENAKKRIKILKNTNDGFKISDEDMKLRGYGDLLGFKQSGIKSFLLADPIINEDLFILAEKEIRKFEDNKKNIKNYIPLLKLYDRADIVNDIV
tara:strand:- start:3402 stop:5441 length:2040 start_codon:yes stop_codon:yes gene_type:complete